MEITDINDALRAYNKVEDTRDQLRATYEAKDSKLRAARDQLELFMLERMKELELVSFAVPGEGTASMRVKRRFGGADWALIWDWVVREKCPNMLQKRLLDTAVQAYVDEHQALPPGVSSEARQTIVVTKR